MCYDYFIKAMDQYNFKKIEGKWQKIWPVFGAANQLVAALALFVLTCWLLVKHKTTKFTLIPTLFMLITTIAALVFQIIRYFIQKDMVLLLVSCVLVGLAGFMIYEASKAIFRKQNQDHRK